MRDHRSEFPVRTMSRVLRVHPSGFYAWLKQPLSARAIEDRRLIKLIKASFVASGGTYGSPWIHKDVREAGERCSVHRVARLMRESRLRAQIGYKRRYIKGGRPAKVADNRLQRDFTAAAPNQAWVTDITYVRTYEGFLYLAVVVDLFSRRVVGWSMQNTLSRDLVIQALLMAVWRRQPTESVLVHSDQGSQYGSHDYLSFLRDHGLEPSMSRRGNCLDNAVAESFFATLKKQRIRNQIYATREEARGDIFDFIELFYNVKKRHGHIGGVSPREFEAAYFSKRSGV
jgi:putative transposase